MKVDWTDPWFIAQVAYIPVGMVVWMWALGLIGMWESPILRLCLFLLNPRKIPIPTTPRNAFIMMPGALAMILLAFASFILWPLAALFCLGWLACVLRKAKVA